MGVKFAEHSQPVSMPLTDGWGASTIRPLMRGRAEVARRAHNPEVSGSNPLPATKSEPESVVLYRMLREALVFDCPKGRRREPGAQR